MGIWYNFTNGINSTKKILLDILIAAFILTVFEIVFFRTEIVKTIRYSLKYNINKFAKSIAEASDTIFRLPGNFIKAIKEEEDILRKKYDQSVMYDGVWILGLLFIAIILIYNGTSLEGKDLDWWSCDLAIKLGDIAIFPFFTTLFFILFQIYFFYIITKKYKYPSEEELQLISIDSMINAIEHPSKE